MNSSCMNILYLWPSFGPKPFAFSVELSWSSIPTLGTFLLWAWCLSSRPSHTGCNALLSGNHILYLLVLPHQVYLQDTRPSQLEKKRVLPAGLLNVGILFPLKTVFPMISNYKLMKNIQRERLANMKKRDRNHCNGIKFILNNLW